MSTYFLVTPLEKILSDNQPNLSSSDISFEIDPKNVIMVTLEEIPEEQRKAFEAHRQAAEERRKVEKVRELQEFLACFKKERQGKVTDVKEIILPSNSGKTKVMPDVSTSFSSVTPKDVTGTLNDHTKHLINHLHYMLENGLVKIFKTLNPSADSGSAFGTPQAPSSSAHHEALENPLYDMLKNFTPSQAPPVMSTLPSRPETAMVISPPIVEPLNNIPSSVAMNQTNELASFVPSYQMVAYSTPPIPPRGTGIPRGLVPDYYFNNKYDSPDRVSRTEPRGASVNSFDECLAAVREDFKKQIRETFGVELSSKSRIYQKLYPSYFDLVPYLVGWRTPILFSSVERTIGLRGSTLVNI
jgi:hypothetical protein